MSDFIFGGFKPSNTTPVPDILFDVLLPHLNEAQLKVMLYIIRRTLGFKKTADAISLHQFRWGITTKDEKKLDEGCGLKNYTTISKALQSLERMGCIESEKRKTVEGDDATTVYRIHFVGTTLNVVPTTHDVVGVLRQKDDRTTLSAVGVLRQKEPQETVLQLDSLQETDSQERAVTDARALEYKNDNHSYSHDEAMGHKAWNCEAWCRAHEKTCAEYQAYIDSKAREETLTEPRVEAVKIGASNGTRDTDPATRHPVTDRLASLADQDTTVAQGVTDGLTSTRDTILPVHGVSVPDRSHSPADLRTQEQVTSASTPGRAASPPAAAHDPHSLQAQDGATTALESGEPRASGERNVPLSAHEAEMKAWLEEVRATEVDLDARDVTAIRSLSTKKGTDDKEMFLNIVAVIDSDPWFEEHHISVDFYWINRQWNNKYMFLQRKKPKAALDDGERHSDFDIYKGNGPEARKKWREEGARLKALGYSPDL